MKKRRKALDNYLKERPLDKIGSRDKFEVMHQPVFALGLPHGWELGGLILLVVFLFGADKIPKLARGFGRSLGEFKKAKDDFDREIHAASATDETKRLAEQNNPTIAPPMSAPGSTPVSNPPAAGSSKTI